MEFQFVKNGQKLIKIKKTLLKILFKICGKDLNSNFNISFNKNLLDLSIRI